MGYFSWKFADTNNEKRLCLGKRAYLACPDGTMLRQYPYEGHGEFGGKDVYELVVDWNLEDLDPSVAPPASSPEKSRRPWEPWQAEAIQAMKQGGDALAAEVVRWHVQNGGLPGYLLHDWKRCIGISIACTTYQNNLLRYPIKVMKYATSKYEGWPASDKDPNQGL